MQKISPFLWFDDQAEEAVKLYTSLFKNSKTGSTARYDEAGAKVSGRKAGSVMTVAFQLNGQDFTALNGGPLFKFTPAISLFAYFNEQKEIDTVFEKLSAGGKIMMPLAKYPFAERFAFFQDKYGVSWQLMLAKTHPHISPSLLFVGKDLGKAEAAVKHYVSIFKNSKINTLAHYRKNMPGKEGTVEYCSFTLEGQSFVAMDGTGPHAFAFNESISFVINCETQAEVDYFWEKLSEGGETSQCGWLKDKFGISWQVVPTILGKLLSDPKKSKKVMEAMLKMTKLDVQQLENAGK